MELKIDENNFENILIEKEYLLNNNYKFVRYFEYDIISKIVIETKNGIVLYRSLPNYLLQLEAEIKNKFNVKIENNKLLFSIYLVDYLGTDAKKIKPMLSYPIDFILKVKFAKYENLVYLSNFY